MSSLIENWEDKELKHPCNTELKGSRDFEGPEQLRKCTDVFFLGLFIFVNAVYAGLAVYLLYQGDTNQLVQGHDFRGDVCGVGNLESAKYMYYPDPSDLTVPLCVKTCPTEASPESMCYYDSEYIRELTEWGCWDSIPCTTFGYYCLPHSEESRKKVVGELYEVSMLVIRAAGDVRLAWDAVVVGVLVAVLQGFLCMKGLKRMSLLKVLIFIAITECFLLLGMTAGLFYLNSRRTYNSLCKEMDSVYPSYCYQTPSDNLKTASIVTLCLLGVFLVYVLLKKNSISLGLDALEASIAAVKNIRNISVVPLLVMLVGLGVLTLLTTVTLFAMSTADKVTLDNNEVPGGKVIDLKYQQGNWWILVFVLFVSVWWLAILSGVSEFVVAGAIGYWFFTRERSHVWKPFWRSLKILCRFHLGSLIRGGFSNLFTLLPFLLLKPLSGFVHTNKTKCFSKCCACTCWPLLCNYENCLKYYSKQACFYLAIFGKSYSVSAKESYFLISRNKSKVCKIMNSISTVTAVLKLSITILGFFVTYSIVVVVSYTPTGTETSTLTARTGPAVVSLILAVFIAEVCGGTIFSCINTLLVCTISDQEMFTGDRRFTPQELEDLFEITGNTAKEPVKVYPRSLSPHNLTNPREQSPDPILSTNNLHMSVWDNYQRQTKREVKPESLFEEDARVRSNRPNKYY